MFPTGDIERLKCQVMERYTDVGTSITFGILIADYNQSQAREYIVNYLNIFDNRSNRYIDFFIPGYTTYGDESIGYINKNGEKYYFDRKLFENFIVEFEDKFDFEYQYSPALILVELKEKDFFKSRKIIINLNDINGGEKKSGVLFNKIFEIAKQYVNISDFSRELNAVYVKNKIGDKIINALGNNLISEAYDLNKGMETYRLK